MLRGFALNEITPEVLKRLEGTREDRHIEFKQSPPGSGASSATKIETFLKYISSFANTEGGDIVYGVKEGEDSSGHRCAEEIVGFADDPEVVRLRFDDWIR